MKCYAIVFITFAFVYILKPSEAEYYTAISELEKLLDSLETVVKTLEAYQRREEERMTQVKWMVEQFRKLQQEAINDTETFLFDPINAYLLIKRLSHDLELTTRIARNLDHQDLLDDITPGNIDIPTKDDLSGAASALLRLQYTFLLNTSSLARGEINGYNSSLPLSAGDCLEMGRQALDEHYYNYAIQWLEESMDKLKKEEGLKTANLTDVLEYMAFAYFNKQDYNKAIEMTEELLYIDPYNPRVTNNLLMYWNARSHYEAEKAAKLLQPDEKTESKEWPKEYMSQELVDDFEKLCRGESAKTPKEESLLNCYQTSHGNSYLTLQPVKMEVLHLKPRIVMYYDVLRESEADTIKSVAQPVLQRAKVVNATTGLSVPASYRISKSAWLYDKHNPMIPKISRRVGAISGLDVKYAEPLLAINYGIGGHYNPHIDFAHAGENIPYLRDLGNRMATWIFYLSHVPAGGSTVFPNLGVEVKPVKGAAAFWYNLYRNGTGIEDTIHAACPVLTGSKWVANKWLHENGNEFRRPCSLNQLE